VLKFGSTAMVRFTYVHPSMSWLDALYFTTETVTSVGFGDYSFAAQSPVLRYFAIGLMFAGVTVTAILVALVADLLLSRRFVHTAGIRRARRMRDHIVVVGLGSTGIRVVTELAADGYDVVVIEHDENNRFLPTVAKLDVPVIFGDSTMRQTLESARVDRARGVAVMTQDDMENIRTGIVLLEMLGSDTTVPIVRAERCGEPAIRFRKRAVGRGSGSPMVHRRGDGSASPGNVLGRAALVHGRRDAGSGGQRARRAANGGTVHSDTGYRDHPTGRTGEATSAP
jgi:hypothetical protein